MGKKKKEQTEWEKRMAEREAHFLHIEGGFGFDLSRLYEDDEKGSYPSYRRTDYEPSDQSYFSEW